jgi:hypothetical protein
MKIYIVLNEKKPKAASDVHNAMEYMKEKQIIFDYEIYSYVYELNSKPSQLIISEICSNVIDNAFDIVLWMHPQLIKLSKEDLKKLENLKNKNIIFGLWDGDLFGDFFNKNIPKTLKKFGKISDATFVQGLGYFSKKMEQIGSKNVEFVPAVGDRNRFDIENKNKNKNKYDVVLIGNNHKRKISFMDMEGAKLRRKIVKLFTDKLGDRFAVFGMGWEKCSSNKGRLDYTKQAEVYHNAKIAIGTNNLSAKYYFSDRLPIAMLSGKPVVNSYEEGLTEFFKGTGVFLYKDEYEALAVVKKLLNENDEKFRQYKQVNSEFAKSKLLIEHLMEYMVTYLISLHDDTKKPSNPWI